MADRIVSPGSDISTDTHVSARRERVEGAVTATPSAADPRALVKGNRVSTGEELEQH